jgi:hypothetical protein
VRIDHVIWATGDLDAAAARLEREHGLRAAGGGTELVTITRQGFTGRLTGVAEAMAEPCLPFFVERGAGVPDPGGSTGAGGLAWVEVAGEAERVAAWLGGAELPLRVRTGAPALLGVGVGGRQLR